MLVLGLGSPFIIPLLFGQGLPDAVMVLAILSLALPIRFVHSSFSATFVSPSEVASKVGYLGWAALCGVAANLALVPLFGLAGAPIAAVLSEIVLLALHVKGMHRLIEGVSIRATFQPATPRASLRLLLDQGRHAD
jgi:O-antigen/teichoic acid export membrane protein